MSELFWCISLMLTVKTGASKARSSWLSRCENVNTVWALERWDGSMFLHPEARCSESSGISLTGSEPGSWDLDPLGSLNPEFYNLMCWDAHSRCLWSLGTTLAWETLDYFFAWLLHFLDTAPEIIYLLKAIVFVSRGCLLAAFANFFFKWQPWVKVRVYIPKWVKKNFFKPTKVFLGLIWVRHVSVRGSSLFSKSRDLSSPR